MASLSHKIAWNTIVQVLGKVASTTLGVIITILLTRYLGPAGYGTYIFVFVFVTMFGTVSDWGLTLITVREASKNEAMAAEIIGNVLLIRLILAVIAAFLAIVSINFLPYDSQTRVLVAVASLFLVATSLKTSFQIIFNAKLTMQYSAISDVTANSLSLVLLLFLIYSRAGLVEIILAFLAGDFFAALVAARLGAKMLPLRYSLFHEKTKYLLFESLPMGAILVLFTIYNRLDTVILSLYQGSTAVGLYSAAYRIFEVLVLGAAYFANSVLPLISSLAQNDREKLQLVYRKSFIVLLFLGTGVALANFIFAPLAIKIVAGKAFAASVAPLQILSLALIVSYFNHLNGYTLIALGKQWYSLAIAVIALFVNITLNLIFIPQYSFYAAAAITFVTEGLIVVLSISFLRKEANISPRLADIPAVVQEAINKRGRIF